MNMLAQEATSGVNWNTFVNNDVFPVVLIWVAVAIMIVLWVAVVQWRRVRIAEAEVGLKLKMLERGYSADEIAKVLQAGLPTKHRKRRHHSDTDKGCCTSDFVRGSATG